jgi:diguanylate cyclase (GGDEF)-like protein
MVAVEMARLLQCAGSGILRLRDADSLVVVGSYGESPTGVYQRGTVVPVRSGSDLQRALSSGLPVRIDAHPPESPAAHLGYRASIVAPVCVGERMWGMLAVAGYDPSTFDRDDEQTLREFGDLLATAIASAEERERLAEQALSDALTGLANQRALHARLEAELARAARHESPLAVAMIDVDHFKEINDNAGHETGDEMLVRVAAALESFARAEDTLARVGGDEFAWVLPDTTREQALVAVERARRLIAAAPPDPYRITISVGICDTETTTDPTELIRLADSALYWSKAHGRNQSWVYDPAVVDELSEQERAERLERSQALDGLRALVRALEARDLATREHSERVGLLAGRLAARLGWSRDRALLLSQAALLHDVGRVGRSESVVRVSPPVSAHALDELRSAAVASARTVDGLLPSEQVAWIGGQFGAVTDEGARVDSDAEGASIVAVANLWDLLTAVTPGLPVHALAECERLAGERFSRRVVGALSALAEAGELGPGGTGPGSAGEPVGADE